MPMVSFFDMDKTILSESTELLLMHYLRRMSQIAWWQAPDRASKFVAGALPGMSGRAVLLTLSSNGAR
jgi:hypothetical protein